MQRRMYLPVLFGAALVSTLAYPVLTHADFAKQTHSINSVPNEIVKCLPKVRQKTQIIANTTDRGTAYYIIHTGFKVDEQGQQDYAWGDFLVASESTGCVLLTPPPVAQTLYQAPLTQYVPQSAARKLSVSKWQKELARYGSKKALEEDIRKGLQPGPEALVLFPEDVWALKQLGIDVSE